jgi:CTP:molybdopterin cytidylyltransferase MocA
MRVTFPSPPVVAVVPAAGQSSRFGSMKLLAGVDGDVLLNRTIRSLLDGGCARVIVVISPSAALTPATLLRDPRVVTVVNPDPSRGMFSSIQVGLAATNGGAVLVLPADMPFVRPVTVSAVVEAARVQKRVVVPVHDGRRGHPLAIPDAIARDLCADDPRSNLKAALIARAQRPLELQVDDRGILRDVDVPADLARDE